MKTSRLAASIFSATTWLTGSSAARADVVTDWNQTAIEVLKAANVANTPWSRSMAMVHVAMSDAVNSVQGRYARYAATLPAGRAASSTRLWIQSARR
jgi:hypothetical protein